MVFQFSDLINGIFEFGIGLLQVHNVSVIRRDREVRGIHWGITAWTSLWGTYNLYYYPHLGQYISFIGGLLIFGANMVWLTHALQYQGIIKWHLPFVPRPLNMLSTTTLLIDPLKQTEGRFPSPPFSPNTFS